MWWISYRGEGRAGTSNIGVFDDGGSPSADHPLLIDPSPGAQPLCFPRGFVLAGDDLYIANAWRRDSRIVRYRRQDGRYQFVENVATSAQVAAMIHPFDLKLAEDGRLYVSCQDTNTVVVLLRESHQPAPVCDYLRNAFPSGYFFPGTLVASERGHLPDVTDYTPQDVPSPQGLKVISDVHGWPRHSVRGIVVRGGYLYVADEAADAVKVYAVASGRLVARIRGERLTRPVHLLLHEDTLYIGAAGSGSVFAYDIPAEGPMGKLTARVLIDRKLEAPSGMAVGPDGDLYVAERFGQRVMRFSIDGKKKGIFIDLLPDIPEFLVHAPDG